MDSVTKAYRIDAAAQTLVLLATDGLPVIAYWGQALPMAEDLTALAQAGIADLTGGMLDRQAPLSICPVGDGVYQGQPALEHHVPLAQAFRQSLRSVHA